MEKAVTYILELEPWNQVDACAFTREMKWVLAVTPVVFLGSIKTVAHGGRGPFKFIGAIWNRFCYSGNDRSFL